jgi:hypothetical protein
MVSTTEVFAKRAVIAARDKKSLIILEGISYTAKA